MALDIYRSIDDPTIGRWTQPDPSDFEANSYAYAACNPLNFVDPGGLTHTSVECRFMTGVGAGAALASIPAIFVTPPVGIGVAVVSGIAFLASYKAGCLSPDEDERSKRDQRKRKARE